MLQGKQGCCCCQCIPQGEIGVIEQCGQFSSIANAGLSCLFWPVSDVVATVSTRVQQLDVITDTKTKDNVTMGVKVAVQYRIINRMLSAAEEHDSNSGMGGDNAPLTGGSGKNPEHHGVYKAYYKLTDASMQIRAYVEDVVRSEIPLKTLDEAYEVRG